MITVLVVGIGSGSPAHLTAEAVAALNRVDVFLVADKRARHARSGRDPDRPLPGGDHR